MTLFKVLKVVLALCVLVASTTFLVAAYLFHLATSQTLFLEGAHYTTGNFIRFGIAAVMGVLSSLYVAISIRDRSDSADSAGVQDGPPELSGVRIRAGREVLEGVQTSASRAGWTESHYDEQGRLVLPPPPNYRSEDFGRLLQAIDRFQIDGLQLLGPHGGSVDADGIEHVDQ